MTLSKEVLQVLNENPDLPVYAWVNSEVCEDEGMWAGQVHHADVREFTKVPFEYGWCGTDWVFKDEQEEAIEYLINTEEYFEMFPSNDREMTEKAEAYAKNYLDSLEYTKAIFIWISTLD